METETTKRKKDAGFIRWVKYWLLIDDNEPIFYKALVWVVYCLVIIYFAVVVNYIHTLYS